MKTQMLNQRVFFTVFVVAGVMLASGAMISNVNAQWVSAGQTQGISIWRNTRTNLEWTTSLNSVSGNSQARDKVSSLGFRLPTFDELADVVNNDGGISKLNIRTGLFDYYETSDPNVLAGAYGNNIRTRLSRRAGTNYAIGVRKTTSTSNPIPPNQGGPAPIVEIRFQYHNNAATAKRPIPGFELLDFDLNRGMGGSTPYIYLFYRRSWQERPITGLNIIVGQNARPQDGFTKIDFDLNTGAGGDYLYLCYTRNPDLRPIKRLAVRHQNVELEGYKRIDVNLNKGGGRRGDDIFLWYGR